MSEYVAHVIKVLKNSGLKYELGPMGTIIEADITTLINIIPKLHEVPFKMGVKRVYTLIKIDDRRDKDSTIEQKIKSVKEKITD